MAATALGLALMLGGCASEVAPSTSNSVADETPLPNGVTRVTATSAMVLPGTMQPLSLYTHCGLENAVIDFAGSLWDPAGFPSPPRGIGNPVDGGPITLTGIGTAVFVSASGVRIDLVPHPGTIEVMICY